MIGPSAQSPSLSSNIISLSYLDKEGFVCVNGNGRCSIYKNDVLYAYGDLHDNHYILKLEQRHNNDIYNIDTKRIKIGESNPTYLWHCRLGHINERRLEKLHRDGLLSSFDFESYDAKSNELRSQSLWSFSRRISFIWPKRQCQRYVGLDSLILILFVSML